MTRMRSGGERPSTVPGAWGRVPGRVLVPGAWCDVATHAVPGTASEARSRHQAPGTRHFISIIRLVALAALVGSSVSCGDLVRQGRSPVYVAIDALTTENGSFLLSDVQSDSGSVFDDVGSVVLRTSLKDVLGTPTNPAAPTTNNDVTINRVHIAYRRSDGRNAQGMDVPYAFDGAATATLSVGRSINVSFELVRHEAKLETPLVQLRSSLVVITTLADVTFYGRDQAGNEVSVTGTIQVNFGDFAG